MTTENKGKLIEELKQFGLNPQDWVMKRVGTLQFKLQHKSDPNFVLLGKGKYLDTRPKWAQIQLISL